MATDYDKKTVSDVPVGDKRVFVRVDFNVPMNADGQITDDRRVREALPTIRYLIDHSAIVILASHLGRPGGKPNPKYSLLPIAEHLSQLLGQPVTFIPEDVGPVAQDAVQNLRPGQVALLQNLRFYPGEEANSPEFAKELASLGDVYVDDAFGAAHRAHASTVGIAQYLPAVSGMLMEKELRILGTALENPRRPLVAVVGGAKVSSKIDVVNHLLPRVDRLLVGGGMANTFLKASGREVGKSLVENDQLPLAQSIMAAAGEKLLLPVDVVLASEASPKALASIAAVDQVPSDQMILDIGPRTVDEFGRVFQTAGTVIWNGPVGLNEIPIFAEGTLGVGRALAKSPAISIVGGGDLVAALQQLGIAEQMTHVSTGGGASLEFLEGKVLPGVAVLESR